MPTTPPRKPKGAADSTGGQWAEQKHETVSATLEGDAAAAVDPARARLMADAKALPPLAMDYAENHDLPFARTHRFPNGEEVLTYTEPSTGYTVALGGYGATYLTDCCGATATGTEDGTACRACYEEIDPGLGGIPDENLDMQAALLREHGDIQTLGGLNKMLSDAPARYPIVFDTGGSPASPHSYRGSYDHLAIEARAADYELHAHEPWYDPTEAPALTVAEFRDMLDEQVGATHTGYKGGQFQMNETTPLHLANWGDTGRRIVGVLVDSGYDSMYRTPEDSTGPRVVLVTQEDTW